MKPISAHRNKPAPSSVEAFRHPQTLLNLLQAHPPAGRHLDGGLAAAEAFVEPLVGPVTEATLAAEADWDAKSRLQEWSQAELGVTPRYRIVTETGPDHAKTFVAEVLLGKEVAGQGTGRSKQAAEQAAEQAAAQAAWEILQRWINRFGSRTTCPDDH